MRYRFRLRIAARQIGKFEFDAADVTAAVSEDLALKLVARNADTLARATTFHFEAGGYESEPAARSAGERLRVRLRLLNAVLNLGIHVPVGDSPSSALSPELNEMLLKQQDCVAIEGVWGLTTFPDDGRHFECVVGGDVNVRPSDPHYVFDALKTLWALDVKLDEPSEEALSILGLATLEVSEKGAFLTSYLALEQLIERSPRSAAAAQLIERFQRQVKKAVKRKRRPLTQREADSLCGALGALRDESFSNALMRFADRLSKPKLINGRKPRAFLSACIDARNRIAHRAVLDPEIPLTELTAGLRELVLTLVWTQNNLADISIATPPSALSIPDGVAVRLL